jgi:ubiquinone/menaquinone biosynthesis C-methylase UbiE
MKINKKNISQLTNQFIKERPMFFGLIRPIEIYIFKQFLPKNQGKVLDFGCGDGYFASFAFNNISNLIGVDVRSSRINETTNKNLYKKQVFYDGKTLPFKNNTFDLIVSSSVLEHIKTLDRSLTEIERVLKPGGLFLTTVMTNNWEKYLLGKKIFGNSYASWIRKNQEHYQLLSAKEWRSKFKLHNLKVIEAEGYLPEKNSHYLEIFHYLSFPSLISYKLTGQWVSKLNSCRNSYLLKVMGDLNSQTFTTENKAASIFFKLKK